MRKEIPLLFFLASVTISPLLAQGDKADYERTAGLRERFSGKVFKETIRPQWFGDDEKFVYRNSLPDGKSSYVLVDVKASSRSDAFDHATIAEKLEEILQRKVSPERLPIEWFRLDEDGRSLLLRVEGKLLRYDQSTNRLENASDDTSSEGLRASFRVRRSSHTGPRTDLRFVNTLSVPVEIFWIDTEGQEKSYGNIAAGESRTLSTYEGHVWAVRDAQRKLYGVYEARLDVAHAVIKEPSAEKTETENDPPRRDRNRFRNESGNEKFSLSIVDHNIRLQYKGASIDVTNDGGESDSYHGPFLWSPDGKHFIAQKTKKPDQRKVYYVESSPKDQLQPKLHDYDYLKPGDRIAQSRPVLFRIDENDDGETQLSVTNTPISNTLFENPWSVTNFSWHKDGSCFYFLFNQRGHQVVRYLTVETESGVVRVVAEEASETFVSYTDKVFTRRFDESDELIWMSQRDGWNHLYLIDTKSGATKNQITRGAWPVRSVEKIDPEKRVIWFYAGGVYPEQDSYYLHYCRVNFDGSDFRVLTEGDGTHRITHSPNGSCFIDTFSRVDMPPCHELRCGESGRLICELEKADHSELLQRGWIAPERFVAKGRDGVTDIHGIIIRPTNFVPEKKYPVIECIYAGPHGSFVPKEFQAYYRMHALAELGFILVQIDGMGTNHRSKAFHDVCWKNLGDSGFPDRILWLRAAAKKYPFMDLTRVGIYGGSAGGQSSTRALLAHGDFYKVAVSDCGCHDNRMDKIWWNEQWMGWPLGPHYEEQSNVTQAHRLTGKLMLTVGEADRNVDPASTMQLVNALIAADKDFDFLLMTGQGHGSGEHPYADRRRMDFFVRHLHGLEPRRDAE